MNIPLSSEQQALSEKLLRESGSAKYKAVSFRMSGTLVVYPFAQKEDIFAFMEKDLSDVYTGKYTFTELRTAAEDEAEKKNSDRCSVDIEQIYDIFMKRSKLSFEVCKRLMDRECELAEFFAMPRGLGKKLFDEARRKGKRTLIVDDTIYPRKTTEKILKKCGYPCGNIISAKEISCGISADEAIFAAILEKSHSAPEKLLHIGGNVVSDVELPITKGAKALLLTNSNQLMVKSGRLRGFLQTKLVYDNSPADHISLRCAMGLCAVYLFDIPLHKVPLSDFCADPYILGFTVWGALHLIKAYQPESDIETKLVSAFAANEEITHGMEDFLEAFRIHFGDLLIPYGYKDCDLPLKFLVQHSAPADRELLSAGMGDVSEKWAETTTEPSLAPVTERSQNRSATAKLADKMFPPGTKVRNMADAMLVKMKSKKLR